MKGRDPDELHGTMKNVQSILETDGLSFHTVTLCAADSPGKTTHQGDRDESPHVTWSYMSLGKDVEQYHDERGDGVPRPERLLPCIQRPVSS